MADIGLQQYWIPGLIAHSAEPSAAGSRVHIWQCTLQSLYINQINSPPQYWQILRLIFWGGGPSMSQLLMLVVV